jgi:hypothetical protein
MKKVGGELAETILRQEHKEAAKSSEPVIDDAIKAMKAGEEATKKKP